MRPWLGTAFALLVLVASTSAQDRRAPVGLSPRVEPLGVHEMRVFPLDLGAAQLRVADVGMTSDLRRALGPDDVLAVNAGFFDPAGRPVGLVVSGAELVAPFAPRLGGGVFAIDRGRARLFDAESFELPTALPELAVHCRPRLVVDGRANVRSDDGRAAERTALCARDGGTKLDVIVVRGGEGGGPTLFELARALEGRGCESALNLDGGPSTGVAWRERTGLRALPPRGPVRHAIVVSMRAAAMR